MLLFLFLSSVLATLQVKFWRLIAAHYFAQVRLFKTKWQHQCWRPSLLILKKRFFRPRKMSQWIRTPSLCQNLSPELTTACNFSSASLSWPAWAFICVSYVGKGAHNYTQKSAQFKDKLTEEGKLGLIREGQIVIQDTVHAKAWNCETAWCGEKGQVTFWEQAMDGVWGWVASIMRKRVDWVVKHYASQLPRVWQYF